MLNSKNRKKINIMISNISHSENILKKFEKDDSNLSEKEWFNKRIQLVDSLNNNLEELDLETKSIFNRNYCKKVQNSINYYRNKAGLNKLNITAYI